MKYLKYLIFIAVFLTLAAAELLAHSSIRFHTGQTQTFETGGGEDGDVDGAKNNSI